MRCSVQPGRRSSYPRKEPEDNLVLHLKLDNNFDDSSEWKQKVIQPSEALPYFDDRNYYNNNYSTIYGQLTSNPLDNQKVQIMSDAFEHFSSIYEYSDIDGIRLKLPDGWALIRCSNTQPVIVCRVEAIGEKDLEKYKNLVLDKLLSLGVKIDEDF